MENQLTKEPSETKTKSKSVKKKSSSNSSSTSKWTLLTKLPTSFLQIQVLDPLSQEQFTIEKSFSELNLEKKVEAKLYSSETPYLASITRARQLTREDSIKRCLGLEIDLGNSGISYEPGDAFGINCQNDVELVQKLGKRLQLNLDSLIQITSSNSTSVVPLPYQSKKTIREILVECLDFYSVPKKVFLRVLAEYTSNEDEKDKLLFFCSREGSEAYRQFVLQYHSLLELFEAFPSCLPPFERLLEHVPLIFPRVYSVATSPLKHPSKIFIAFNVIQFQTASGKLRKGLCTGWLEHLVDPFLKEEAEKLQKPHTSFCEVIIPLGKLIIPIFKYTPPKPPFHLPPNCLETPFIMVGPGTGVAPFVGFMEHRHHLIQTHNQNINLAPTWLFFGSRHEERDFIFRRELESFLQSGSLTRLITAFSRDKLPTEESSNQLTKIYVQHRLKECGKEVADLLINQNAFIYVCG